MKKNILFVLCLALIFSACTKNGSNSKSAITISNISNLFSDTIKIPITDLGTGTYFGFTGGLYPGGINTPSGQYAKDLNKISNHIFPLDSTGKKSDSGKVVFISIGGSTGGHNMMLLREKTIGNPETNPRLLLLNCNNGYQSGSLNSIMNPNDPYWDHVNTTLKATHTGYKQVQIIYLETEDSAHIAGFPSRPYYFKTDLETAVRTCKTKFPKLKLLYVLGRTTTFDVVSLINIEPAPYWNGWAEKFMIEDQINGVQGTEYKGDSAVAPLVTWGWYQWADGTTIPRQDGFVWQKSETADGLHANDIGQDTLTTRFQNFLLTDQYASIWYANHNNGKFNALNNKH